MNSTVFVAVRLLDYLRNFKKKGFALMIRHDQNLRSLVGQVQNTQMTQETQKTQIRSNRLKHADGGGADGDFSSACFRRSKIRRRLLDISYKMLH